MRNLFRRDFFQKRKRKFIVRLSLLLGAAFALSLFLTACEPPKKIVLVFGDSLVSESEPYIRFQFSNSYDVRIVAYGGTALCDYASDIVSDINDIRPAAAVIAFTGNAITPCMSGTSTEAQIAAKYQSDLSAVLAQVAQANVPIGVVTAPPSLAATGAPIVQPSPWAVGQLPTGVTQRSKIFNNAVIASVQQAQAQNIPVSIIDGYSPFAAPATDGWTKVLPCLSFEQGSEFCRNGLIDVRSADLVHLCPVANQLPCPVWSSGEWRWAGLITNHVKARLSGMRGFLDDVQPITNGVRVSGWAFDMDGPALTDIIHVYAGDQIIGGFGAGRSRPDIGAFFPIAGANHGFSENLSLTPGTHNICAYALNLWGSDRDQHLPLGCRTVTVAPANPIGFLDSVTPVAGGARVAGWALDWDAPLSPVTIRVYANFALVGTTTASSSRSDVAGVFPGTGSSHGYSFQVSIPAGVNNVCAVAVNIGFGQDVILGCQRVTILAPLAQVEEIPPSSTTTTTSTTSTTTTTVAGNNN